MAEKSELAVPLLAGQQETVTPPLAQQQEPVTPIADQLEQELFRRPPIPRLISALIYLIQREVEWGDIFIRLKLSNPYRWTVFDNFDRRYASIGIPWYLENIYRNTDCVPHSHCFVIAYIYLIRFGRLYSVDSSNIHRLLLTSIVMASWYYHGHRIHTNEYFAYVGRVELTEIDQMETQFLSALNYDISVTDDELYWYITKFRSIIW